jgi:2-polyprenyl-3-methyl-5-hydroxy-6-metoxy-1,4-benzoquinol methylase
MDIACGDGCFTKRLAGLYYKDSTTIGFDTEDIAIRSAIEKTNELSLANLSFVCGNAFDHAKEADLIVATDVIEHLYNPDKFMMYCFNTLIPGGYLFFIDTHQA